MPIAQQNEGKFKEATAGMQPGILVRIIDLGTQKKEYMGDTSFKRQLLFQYELPEEKLDDGRPLLQGDFINLAIGEKATLSKIAVAMTGEHPRTSLDPKTLLGKACNLNIVHNARPDGSTKVKIESYAPLLKGQTLPKPVNELFYFDLDNFDQVQFDSLSDGLKRKIELSPEYQEIQKAA